jgi:hypothetical protein
MDAKTRQYLIYGLVAAVALAVVLGSFFGIEGIMAAIGLGAAGAAGVKAQEKLRVRIEQEKRIEDAAESAGELADDLDSMRETLDGSKGAAEDTVTSLDDEGKRDLGEDLLGPSDGA